MNESPGIAVAVVGVGAILPDAGDAPAFWRNVKDGRYSITEVPKERWDPDLYYDPDPAAPDRTYSKIGGWVRESDWEWNPIGWRLPIPPIVGASMEDSQKWAVACTREALADYGYPGRPLNTERTAVILGNALAGDRQFLTGLRILSPQLAEDLARTPAVMALPPETREAVQGGLRAAVAHEVPAITGDTVLGELSNILAGRVANLFDLHGPNCTMDAACASALAAMNAAAKGLADGDFDAAITGGIDGNMGPTPFVKFSKLGALSATGTRPYDEGADGFVMGEGAAVFLLKRLAEAERDGDRIYAVVRGLAGSSDGKGRGLTAPNPVGQRLAVQWAWERAGVSPTTMGMIEGHGTSTALGDLVEVECLNEVFGSLGLPAGSVALGSAKSNIGHLKAAAGAAGLLKTVLALDEKVLPPSINFAHPNPNIDWAHSPFAVNGELREWPVPAGGVRRAGVSAFGFGGTNFHAVLDEYVPGASNGNGRTTFAVAEVRPEVPAAFPVAPHVAPPIGAVVPKAPLRPTLVLGAGSTAELVARLRSIEADARVGTVPSGGPPAEADLRAPERVALDFGDAVELAEKSTLALHALAAGNRDEWRALHARGIFRGSGPPPTVAFLYSGQGSQYVNMLATLRESEPVVAEVFARADALLANDLGKPLSRYVFAPPDDPGAIEAAEAALMRTEVTQPAVLAADLALGRLLAEYGITPDMVMGHSLGEYAALAAAGCLTFEHALEAVSARGLAVANIDAEDPGRMAAVFGPLSEIEEILRGIDGNVAIANYNSNSQAVITGASEAVARAVDAFEAAGHRVVPLSISHAFHNTIVAPASESVRRALAGMDLQPPLLPVVANVTGEFYPTGAETIPRMLDTLASQVASPVQFVKGLETLYDAGARVFVEVGPKSAVHGFVEDVLGQREDVVALFTNHPKPGDLVSFNHALCGLYAAGLGVGTAAPPEPVPEPSHAVTGATADRRAPAPMPARALAGLEPAGAVPRRVPVPVLRPPLGVCKPTLVTLGPAGRVVVMPDRGGVAAHLVRLLRDRGVTPLVVDDDPAPAALRGRLEEWAGDGAIQGVYWLPALDAEPSIEAMTPADWKLHVRRRVKLLYATMHSLYESVAEPESFLVAATRLGGMHGYDDAGAVAPMGGAVTGFVKAYKRERIEPLVKAVDVEANADPARVAELIVDETMRDPDAVEVGYRSGLRWSVALRERPADDGNPGLPLTPDTVFVVTGAAGGIVSAIVADLAAASGGTFHLLDLAPEPDPDDPDIARFVADRDGLKRDLFERIRARGERATPVMAERELRAVERKQAALAAIEAVRSSGGTATYHELDLTDAGQVGAAIDAIRRRHGRIDVLVHAAGMEISHALPDKESREFDLVFDVKADGWCNLMRAAHDVPLGAAVAFTSVAGRFGNAGQTDYAAANDLLCKHVSSLRTTRPGTRGIAIDWTAWAGIGMATRGSIPQAMAAAGIDMMPPETGIPVVRRELVSGGTRGEVVIAGSLGTLTEDFDETGGLDPELAGALVAPAGEVGPMVGRVSAMTAHDGQTVETVLDPRVQPFLFDHVMDGTALLPGVMGAEAFAEVAALALPGWRVAAIEDMRYDAAFKFYRNEPRKLVLRAAFRPEGDEIVAECRLIGERTLPVRPDPLSTTHFTGSVRLSRAASEPLRIDRVALPAEGFVEAGDIYRVYFHGPSYQVLERAWPSAPGGVALGLFRVDLPPDSAPADAPLVAAPRLIEFCYQTIGSWEIAELGRFGLPRSFERVTLFEHPEGRRTPLVAVVTPRNGGEAFDATVVDADGGVVLRLDGYRSVELPGALDPDQVQIFRGAARSPA